MRTLANIFWLGTKELRSFMRDFVLLGLVIYAFSLAIIAQAQSNSEEVYNASVGIVDEDHSELSQRITHAFLPPYFRTPQPIAERDIVPSMNAVAASCWKWNRSRMLLLVSIKIASRSGKSDSAENSKILCGFLLSKTSKSSLFRSVTNRPRLSDTV